MNWDAIGAIAELLGAVGVIASLVYLAGQVRSSGNQAKAAADQSRQAAVQSVVNKMNDFYNQVAAAGTADLWVRGSKGLTELADEAEQVRFSGFLFSMFRPYEELYHYRQEGLVNDWIWQSIDIVCQPVLANTLLLQCSRSSKLTQTKL